MSELLATQQLLKETQDQLEDLQGAVMDLGPFYHLFMTDSDSECSHCDVLTTKYEHDDDCPVEILRNVLKEQGLDSE